MLRFYNGIYDLNKKSFDKKPIEEEDYAFDMVFRGTKIDDEDEKKLFELLNNLFYQDDLDNVLRFLAAALDDNRCTFPFLIITGSNLKGGLLEKLIKKTFGDFYYLAKSTLFTPQIPEYNHTPDVENIFLNGEKIKLNQVEYKKDMKIHSRIFKQVIGGDRFYAHGKQYTIKNCMMICPEMPQFDEYGDNAAVRRRIMHIRLRNDTETMHVTEGEINKLYGNLLLLLIKYYDSYKEHGIIRHVKKDNSDNISDTNNIMIILKKCVQTN